MRFVPLLLFVALARPTHATPPLNATLLPPVFDREGEQLPAAVVRVDNPSKQAVDLDLHVKTAKGLYWPEIQKPFQIDAGVDHAFVTFDMGCPASPTYGATLSLRDEKERVVARFPTRTYRSVLPTAQLRRDEDLDLADLAPATIGEHLKVSADGNRAVKAEHTLSLARSPREKEPKPEYVPHLALKLTYALDPGWKFLELKPQADALKKIEGQPKSLGLWVYGDASNTQLRLRFTDAAGQTFQPAGAKVDFKGWRYVTIPMTSTPEHELAHWGGKADGEIRYPIRWNSLLLLDNPGREKVSGEIWFAGLTLIE